MKRPRYVCPTCGKDVAAYPLVYSTPESQYVQIYAHSQPDGTPCMTYTVTVAKKLGRRV